VNRRNIIILALILILVTVLYAVFVFRPQSTEIENATNAADAAEQQVTSLQAELKRLEALKERAPELRAQAVQLDAAMPSDPQQAQVILSLQEAADASGIDWLSVSASLPAPTEGNPEVFVVSLSLSVQGGYFQVQDYIVRLETLSRALKISSLSLAPSELPDLSASISLTMYVSQPTLDAPAESAA
jgi:Tfp pilus assembly protein PilO